MAEMVTVKLDYRYETAVAYLVHTGVTDIFLPKSQVSTTDKKEFTMPAWLARKEGLI